MSNNKTEKTERIDAIMSTSLRVIIDSLNERNIKKEQVITMFQNNVGQYIVLYKM